MTTRQLSYSYIGELDPGTIAKQPILDIAARFWDRDRYEAFRICYRSMRWIDDLVDHQKSATPYIIKSKVIQIERTIASWLNAIRTRNFFDSSQKELAEVLHEFRIPLDPWKRFLKSMLYDLQHDGFASMLTFLRYCNGAAIAPASIFMHLCGIRKDGGGYRPPEYDSREAARPLALFSYLVHIIRDFQKDHLSNLNYFPENLLEKYGLDRTKLRRIAEGEPIAKSFRTLIGDYASIAEYYRAKSKRMLHNILPELEDKYRVSLEIIYQLYLQIYERIDPHHGSFTGAALNPSPEEINNRLQMITGTTAPVTG